MRFCTAFVFCLALYAAALPAVNAQANTLPSPSFETRPQTVFTKNEAYRLGSAEMIAPALVDDVSVHPQGRYALIFQKKAALPLLTSGETTTTGASALILYDTKLRKTRTIWSRPADGGEHYIYEAKWLPGTNSAVVVATDTPPQNSDAAARKEAGSTTLLLFNFAKSNTPRVLATTSALFKVDVSPAKPVFVMQDWQGHQARMVNGLTGTLGPVMANEKYGYTVFPAWSADEATVYGTGEILTQDPTKASYPDQQWFAWDGTGEPKRLSAPPPRSAFMKVRAAPLPVFLRTNVLSVPSPVKAALPAAVLHPLFLQAAPDAAAENALSVPVLVAPDADKFYLMPDLSAVLYQSGGALYAVPLIRIPAAQFPKP